MKTLSEWGMVGAHKFELKEDHLGADELKFMVIVGLYVFLR